MTTFTNVKIAYTFRPTSFVKIGTGTGQNSYIDNKQRASLTNRGQWQFDIPGTSVKGRIRANLEQIEHLVQEPVATKIFGKSGQQGWAHVSNLVPTQNPKLGITTSTAIDRFRKAARNGSLRVEEYMQLEQAAVFTGTIEGYVPNDEAKELQIYSLLLALLRTTYFGGDKSTGFGHGEVVLKEVVIGAETVNLANIKQTIVEKLTK